MKITVVGAGYVGLVSGACFAEFGFDVTCVDKDSSKVDALNKGIVPIYEPGLDSLIHQGVKAKRLTFTTDLSTAVKTSDIVMIAVGTPTRRGDGHADLTYVYQAATEIANSIGDSYTVVVTKSTVPVGASRQVAEIIKKTRPELVEGVSFDVASNPEFLREGSAISDFMRPDRVIIGTNNAKASEVLQKLYRPLYLIETPIVSTTLETSELIKYAANGFLALKISFINQMADLCEKSGGDVQVLAKGIGLDKRIGKKFLHAGPGYGGSCFPKDTRALNQIAKTYGVQCSLVDNVIRYNEERKLDMAQRIIQATSSCGTNKKVAVLGLTFKPNTDDLREAPSLTIIQELLKNGFEVSAYDPLYYDGCERLNYAIDCEKSFAKVRFANSTYDAVTDAGCVVILTEWNEFRALDMGKIIKLMDSSKKPLFMDFRNIYNPKDMTNFNYFGLGIGVT
ncbi:MAG: UDP-glucose/GDP-mannose dehydrogenase family protein [Proteobacteria bacterium]|nr:UDP-glucose/GDP-mannose dehydrogenase family protein [Pseudomonadota bacterium]